jgi:predicted ABC-type transport system involved in lysophospholipase L1 biosynthesis ATPase subunit
MGDSTPLISSGDSNMGSPSEAAIRAVDLSKSYLSNTSQVHALRSVSLQIAPGEKIALLGRSGSGKSTLLNILGGLDSPTSGALFVDGTDLAQLSTNKLADYRLSTVGMIFQSFNLISSRTALENVELPMIFAGRPSKERKAAAEMALENVGLGKRLHHRPAELSGGEHQRVAIARALVNRPTVLLADEPTGNLDSATAGEIISILMEHIGKHATTLVMVTHDRELAGRCADRILQLRDGQLVSGPR